MLSGSNISSTAYDFFEAFAAEVNAFGRGMIPQSQLMRRADWVPIDFNNSGVPAVHVFLYIGGTIGCVKKEEGLAPQSVESLEEFCDLHEINYKTVRKTFPNTEYVWLSIPPPLDSGTMEEPDRVAVVDSYGLKIQEVYKTHGRIDAVGLPHGTDSGMVTLQRIAENFSCAPFGTSLVSAQYEPGVFWGDGSSQIQGSILLSHARLAGHFALCRDEVYIPFDGYKRSDHEKGIYGSGPYDYGRYATMDPRGLTIHKGQIRQSSNDGAFLPFSDPKFIKHLSHVVGSYDKGTKELNGGMCVQLGTDDLGAVVRETQRIQRGDSNYRYAIVGALGASNASEPRKAFLSAAAEKGVCCLVASEVPRAQVESPYAAGVKNNSHVTVIQPKTIYQHTVGMFYNAAALTEFIMDVRKAPDSDRDIIRPLLFHKIYMRQRGYSEAYVPGGINAHARISDHALYLWRRNVWQSNIKLKS